MGMLHLPSSSAADRQRLRAARIDDFALTGKRTGSVMNIVVICLVVITVVGLLLADVMARELRNSVYNCQREQALAAADAGIDYAVWYTQCHGANWWQPSSSGTLTGTLPGSGASYTVTISNDTSGRYPGDYILASIGALEQETVTVRAVASPDDGNAGVWTNALFSGTGEGAAGGTTFHGNSKIAGSIFIRGDGVTDPSTVVLSGNGTGGIFNNYADAGGGTGIGQFPGPAVPSTEVTPGSGSPHDLHSYIRVKTGMIQTGNKALGQQTASQPGDKGPLAGSYTGTSPGPTGVGDFSSGPPIADKIGAYDLDPLQLSFPDLVNPLKINGILYNDYFDFLTGPNGTGVNALQYTGNSGNLVIDSSSTLNLSDTNGNSLVAANGVLTIHGVIWAQGSVSLSDVTYQGSGVIVSGGQKQGSGGTVGGETIVNGQDITVSNLLPFGNYNDLPAGSGGFPNNVLGLISMHNLNIGVKNHDTTIGAFFAENQVFESYAQSKFAGSVVCKSFQIFNNDDMYNVPELPYHLPMGMPGTDPLTVRAMGEPRLISYYRP